MHSGQTTRLASHERTRRRIRNVQGRGGTSQGSAPAAPSASRATSKNTQTDESSIRGDSLTSR